MLEPREADIPVLFLVLVVLPLVAYILLGKWSEVTKKRERISLLAQLAAEEALTTEAMAVPNVIPLLSSSKTVCANCFAPATTRCSRCKSIRYWYLLFLLFSITIFLLFHTQTINLDTETFLKFELITCLQFWKVSNFPLEASSQARLSAIGSY